jgi:hypothetical protein
MDSRLKIQLDNSKSSRQNKIPSAATSHPGLGATATVNAILFVDDVGSAAQDRRFQRAVLYLLRFEHDDGRQCDSSHVPFPPLLSLGTASG